jgi:hypothetical protein
MEEMAVGFPDRIERTRQPSRPPERVRLGELVAYLDAQA